jgi:small subunit ribosomal protein S6
MRSHGDHGVESRNVDRRPVDEHATGDHTAYDFFWGCTTISPAPGAADNLPCPLGTAPAGRNRVDNALPSCHGETVAAESRGGGAMRAYEVVVILDPSLEERTIEPSLDKYLNVIRNDGGTVDNVDVWGRRRLAYEVKKNAEGIYAILKLTANPATVKEFDRQLTLNESILRTKVLRADA